MLIRTAVFILWSFLFASGCRTFRNTNQSDGFRKAEFLRNLLYEYNDHFTSDSLNREILNMKKCIVSLLLLMSFNACIKPVQPKLDFCADGHIFWGGDPAANGIGWYFSNGRTGNWKFYQVKDTELASEFKSPADSVAVNICLVSTKDQAPCPCVEPSYYFRIKSIKKR